MPGMQPNSMPRLRRELRRPCLGRVCDCCSTVTEQKPYEVSGEGSVARKLFDRHWCTADDSYLTSGHCQPAKCTSPLEGDEGFKSLLMASD